MHVFLSAHSVSVCAHGVFRAYIYICIYLHTHIKHTCKQDANTDMYACIMKRHRVCMQSVAYATLCMHTRCLFIHIYIDVHTYTHTYKPRYVHKYLDMHTLHLYAHTVSFNIHIYTHTHMYKNRHVSYQDRHVCMYLSLYAYTHLYKCIYIYIHIYVYSEVRIAFIITSKEIM